MLSKSTIKYVRSLRQLKYRQKYHKIIVEGVKLVNDCLNDALLNIDTIYATAEWDGRTLQSAATLPEVITLQAHELANLSAFTTPQQVLAVCDMPDQSANPDAVLSGLCLYLDGIRDPGNMGTIFRIADWFGISTLYLAEDCVDPYNPKVIQASMSSLFRVKWAEYPVSTFLDLKEVNMYAAMSDGQNIYDHPLSRHGLIILGNESTGIRNLPETGGIHKIAIPDTYRMGADSLNVAVAAGIICSEFRRREP